MTGCEVLGLFLIGDSYVLLYHVTVLEFSGVKIVELWDSWRWVPAGVDSQGLNGMEFWESLGYFVKILTCKDLSGN